MDFCLPSELAMSVRKNQSKFENVGLLLMEIQIWSDIYTLTIKDLQGRESFFLWAFFGSSSKTYDYCNICVFVHVFVPYVL